MMNSKRVLAVLVGVGLSSFGMAVGAAPSTQPTTRPYPLATCVVSGDKLGGDMGEPVVYKYEGREVRLCCSGCIKDFKKDPAKYLKKLDEAEAKAATTRPAGKQGHSEHKH